MTKKRFTQWVACLRFKALLQRVVQGMLQPERFVELLLRVDIKRLTGEFFDNTSE